MAKLHVKRGDTVAVLTGDDKGKRGKVLEVFPKRAEVIVDGVNIQKKHTKPTQTNPQGALSTSPGQSMLRMLPWFAPAVRVQQESGERSEDGKLQRLCKKCGRAIN